MNNIDVSIIIPAYNAEKYIERCLKSILVKTKIKKEIIIVNDGSKDNTYNELKKYEKKHSCIKVLTQENSGQARARNRGIDIAKGKYIMFVDIDDFIDVKMINKMYSEIIKDDYDMVYCDYYEYYGEDNIKIVKNNIAINESEKKNAILANYAPWGKLYKKEFFTSTKLKFEEKKYFEDIAIIPVIASMAKKTKYIPEPMYYYNNENESSIRVKTYKKRLEDIFFIAEKTLDNFKINNLLEENYQEIEFIYLDSFLKGSVFRFCDFKEGLENAKKIRKLILSYFPSIKNNKYLKRLPVYNKLLIYISMYFPPKIIYIMKRVKK